MHHPNYVNEESLESFRNNKVNSKSHQNIHNNNISPTYLGFTQFQKGGMTASQHDPQHLDHKF